MDNGKYAQLILFPMRQAMSILDSTIIQVLLISIKIAIDSITVTKTAYATAPDSVKSLTITPTPKGALQATISFITPKVRINGSALARIDSFVVNRDGIKHCNA